MARASVLLVALLFLHGGWAIQPSPECRMDESEIKVKLTQLNSLFAKINKPIDLGFQSTEGILDDDDFKYLGMVPESQPFSLFDQRYYKEVKHVLKLLMKAKDFDHFLKTAEVLHERINEDLLYYCVSVAVFKRNDTRGIMPYPVQDVFPDKFYKTDVIKKLKQIHTRSQITTSTLGEISYVDGTTETTNYANKNNDLNYFLEDIDMNSAHFLWHVLHPAVWWRRDDFDRKGELFFWMHKQMVARYDAERASNDKMPVEPFGNWDEPIPDGFAPHLRIDKIGYRYAYRPPYVVLKDLKDLSKNKMLMWEEQLMKAALRGFAVTRNDTIIDLNNERGIHVLGEMIESSMTSVNHDLYGNLHNYAHVMSGKITDPKGIHDGTYGAMYDVATSARDPLFYSWHKYINRIFEAHKDQLPPYTKEELEFKDVKITKVNVKGTEENVVHTYWQKSLKPIFQGFTFTKNSRVAVKVKQLQHEAFKYEIEVDNSGPPRKAIVRIYAVPYLDYYRKMPFNQLRRRNIELDIFITNLVAGKNTIVRSSQDSSIVTDSISGRSASRHWLNEQCHCFWPKHLLVPKGSYDGMPFSVAVVITDWEQEKVKQEEKCQCQETGSYCNLGGKVPFKRALGFPFDRRAKANNFDEFKTPNMAKVVIKVQFTGNTTYSIFV